MLVYAAALLLTLTIEAPIVAGGLARWYRVPVARGIIVVIAANLLTHPTVWFVLPIWLVPAAGSLVYLAVAEALAWLVEAAIFWWVTRRDPFELLLLSLIANFASFTFGGVLSLLGVW